METLRIFNYNEAPVTFKLGDTTMVNATQMAKPFSTHKRPQFWLKTEYANEFVTALTEARNIASVDLVQVIKGGDPQNQGTWFHEDVALEFARWLSPRFAIWCNDRIKELLRTGTTATSRYDASRNILPGFHLPQSKMIGGSAVWTILLDGVLYYRLKDILVAADMYKYERSVRYTNHATFKPYVYWFSDKVGNRPKRYITKDGVLFILSNTRMMNNPRLPLFLDSFKSGIESAGKRIENKNIKTDNIDLKKFLDFIIRVPDDDNRSFLYDLYKKLK